MLPKRFEWAYRVWPILVAAAKQQKTMTYEDVNKKLGMGGALPVLYALWPIQNLCQENRWPPLTSIVVRKDTGRPGAGCVAFESDLDKVYPQVFAFDWASKPRPFAKEFRKRLEKAGKANGRGSDAGPNDFGVPDQVALANGRGPFQEKFREMLLHIYGGRCALCDTRLKSVLVAAHIVPWSCNQDNRLNPQNGLLLCRTHDSLFECGTIKITPNGCISWPSAKKGALGADLHAFLVNRTASNLPTLKSRHTPAPTFLQWRLDNEGVIADGQ